VTSRDSARGGASRDGAPGKTSRGSVTGKTSRGGAAGKASRGGATGKASRSSATGKTPSSRPLRVAEEIRHLLAGLFARHQVRDPDLQDAEVTVTEVRMTPDLRHATVFYARLGRSDAEALLPALRRASPFMRAQVAQGVRLRHAPDLHFAVDTTLDHAAQLDQMLRSADVRRDLE
jgi:ribosome-binding factor A